jgi:hypothetical protein
VVGSGEKDERRLKKESKKREDRETLNPEEPPYQRWLVDIITEMRLI